MSTQQYQIAAFREDAMQLPGAICRVEDVFHALPRLRELVKQLNSPTGPDAFKTKLASGGGPGFLNDLLPLWLAAQPDFDPNGPPQQLVWAGGGARWIPHPNLTQWQWDGTAWAPSLELEFPGYDPIPPEADGTYPGETTPTAAQALRHYWSAGGVAGDDAVDSVAGVKLQDENSNIVRGANGWEFDVGLLTHLYSYGTPSVSLDPRTESFTIDLEGLVLNSLDMAVSRSIFMLMNSGATAGIFIWVAHPTQKLYASMLHSSGADHAESTTVLSAGPVYRVRVVCEQSGTQAKLTLYLNGTEEAAGSGTPNANLDAVGLTAIGTSLIGGIGDGNFTLKNVRIY